MDISKAFDRVWHAGLIKKLRKCGIDDNLLKWFKSYLEDRNHCVLIDGHRSGWLPITCGVPQGSVLGPLLFLLFINDLVYEIKNCKINMFADDTCLYLGYSDRKLGAKLINEDLENIMRWALKWGVDFNKEKNRINVNFK